MPLFRTQSAAEKTSLAPHGSKARLRVVTTRRGSWRSHVHRTNAAQRVQSFKRPTANAGGRGGRPSSFSGGFKGGILFEKRIPPLTGSSAYALHSPSALCAESNRSPEGAQKRSSPFGLPLFYFSQMTGFWRSDSTKALAFSTASARGSLTCSPVRMSLQDTTPALISSSPRK